MKTCRKCCEQKPLDDFGPHKKARDGHRGICRKCCAANQVEWQKKNREKFNSYQRKYRADNKNNVREWDTRYHAKWRKLNPERYQAAYHRNKCRAYGVTPEWYEEQMLKQSGLCALCEKVCPSGRRLAIDHSHITGKVRQLLCTPCNTALHKFEADIEWVRKAEAYLLRNS